MSTSPPTSSNPEPAEPSAAEPAVFPPGAGPAAATERFPDRELADISAVEVISRAAVMLMSAAAEQLGLASADPANPEHRDLDEARTLITALSGLLHSSLPDLGGHAAAFREGLQALQGAFREYSVVPDEPGAGPGETLGRRSAH